MLNLSIFVISLLLLAWVGGNLGDYALSPTLAFIALFSAISAGYCGLQTVARLLEFLLLEYVPSSRSLAPIRSGISPAPAVLLSNQNYLLYRRRFGVPVRCATVPKSCWF